MASRIGWRIFVASTIGVWSRKSSKSLFNVGSFISLWWSSSSHHPTSVWVSRSNAAIAVGSVAAWTRIARIRVLAFVPTPRVGSNLRCASSAIPSALSKRFLTIDADSASISLTCRLPKYELSKSSSTCSTRPHPLGSHPSRSADIFDCERSESTSISALHQHSLCCEYIRATQGQFSVNCP